MKKLIIFSALVMVLFYANSFKSQFTLLNYFTGEYCLYSNQESENSINLGFCYLSKENSSSLKNIVGESLKIENLEISDAIKTLNAKVVKTEYLENGTTVIYAYSPLIKNNVSVNDKKVNLQIATNKDVSIIGWPLILGSF